jgi:uroporphyrinogen III methyltransferase / synthase
VYPPGILALRMPICWVLCSGLNKFVENTGKVSFIGAGPGGLDYWTERGLELLRGAEVILYDDLIEVEWQKLTVPEALLVPVGKRGGQPAVSQPEINQLLIEYAQKGYKIVRLKAGSPWLFGRLAEELEALLAAGFSFEVVPGISSSLEALGFAGIPLTTKADSRCFGVFSGHDLDLIPWQAVAQLDTLVILMGTRNLPTIAQRLLEQGKPATTPLAAIQWGGTCRQKVQVTTLGAILQGGQVLDSPSTIVIGSVVGARKQYQWFDQGPLFGQQVLVTRAVTGEKDSLTHALRSYGALVLEMPVLEITAPSSWQALDQAIQDLKSFHWLILTSAQGVHYFFDRLQAAGLDSRALGGIKIAVVGQKTAESLQRKGIIPDFIPQAFVADALLQEFPNREQLAGQKVLFPRVESGGREVLTEGLRVMGAEVIEAPAYQSRCPEKMSPEIIQELSAGRIRAITFTSSKTVRHFCDLCTQAGLDPTLSLQSVTVASIGPQTSKTCQELLGHMDVEANPYTMQALADALSQFLKNFSGA